MIFLLARDTSIHRTLVQFGKTVSTALFISLLAIGNPAHAVGWEYAQRIGLSSNYESNPLLTNDNLDVFDNKADNDQGDPEDTFRFLAFYELELEGREDNKSFTIEPRISRDYYPDRDKSDLESTDYDIPASIAIDLPTSRWNLGFGAKRQNILSSEAINEVGGNRFRSDDTVFNYNVSPSVSWRPTPKDTVFISGGWRKQDYDLDYTGRSDFEGYNGAFTYSRIYTQRQTIGFTAIFSSSESEGINCRLDLLAPFDPQPDRGEATPPCDALNQPSAPFLRVNARNKNTADRNALTLDYTFRWSETLEFRASAGRENTETELEVFDFAGNTLQFEQLTVGGIPGEPIPVDKIKSDNDSETYTFTITKRTDRSDFRFSTGRGTVLQSSTGTPQDRDNYDFDIDTRLTQKLRAIVRLSYFEQQSAFIDSADSNSVAGAVDREREFYSAEGVLRYQLTRNLNVFTSYRYRQRDENQLRTGTITDPITLERRLVTRNVDLTADSNQVRFGVVYNFRRLAR